MNIEKPIINILIIGDSAVGKTNILKRFCEQQFNPSFVSTVGIDFKMRDIEVDGKQLCLQVWDTAGQERFKTITQTYYKGAMGIMLVYAINNLESFQNIQNWMNQIKDTSQESVVITLLGNKCDLMDRKVYCEQGNDLAQTYGIKFFETSAKEGTNVENAFYSMAKQIKDVLNLEEKIQQNIHLNAASTQQQSQKRDCC